MLVILNHPRRRVIGLAAARPAAVKLVDDAVVAAVLAEQLAGRVPVRFVGHVHPR